MEKELLMIEKLKADLENAYGGGNIGDIVAAVIALEDFKHQAEIESLHRSSLLPMTEKLSTKEGIACELKSLHYRMHLIALALNDLHTDESKLHAKELAGAASMCWQWACSL
jgi:hypothetical protein